MDPRTVGGSKGSVPNNADLGEIDLTEYPWIEGMLVPPEVAESYANSAAATKTDDEEEPQGRTGIDIAPERSQHPIFSYSLPTPAPTPRTYYGRSSRGVRVTIWQLGYFLGLLTLLCVGIIISLTVTMNRTTSPRVVVNNQLLGWDSKFPVALPFQTPFGMDLLQSASAAVAAGPIDTSQLNTAASSALTVMQLPISATFNLQEGHSTALTAVGKNSAGAVEESSTNPTAVSTEQNQPSTQAFSTITTTLITSIQAASVPESSIIARTTSFDPAQLKGQPI